MGSGGRERVPKMGTKRKPVNRGEGNKKGGGKKRKGGERKRELLTRKTNNKKNTVR